MTTSDAQHKLKISEKNREYYAKNLTGTFWNRLRDILRGARKRAKKNGIEFSLKEEDFTPVYFCPLLPRIKFNFSNDEKSRSSSMSLDRIDPTKGYVKDNVQLISLKANRIKNNATLEEFEEMAHNWRKIENRRNREKNT